MATIFGRFSENIKALVVKDNDNYWATSDFSLTSTIVKQLYRNRQAIEEFFRILKSELRLEGCPSRQAIVQINHIYLVLIAFCQLETFRIMMNISTIYKIRLVFLTVLFLKISTGIYILWHMRNFSYLCNTGCPMLTP